MKKILVILLAAILCLSIVACTEDPVESGETTDSVEATEATEPQATESEETEPEETEPQETEPEETEPEEVDVDAGWNAIYGDHNTEVDPDDFVWVDGEAAE